MFTHNGMLNTDTGCSLIFGVLLALLANWVKKIVGSFDNCFILMHCLNELTLRVRIYYIVNVFQRKEMYKENG